MNQHRITRDNLCQAYLALTTFAQEFEIIYCQCLATCIHFVRPCIHSLMHLPHEVIRLEPPICSSQWTLERTIGNLGEEIKQHSNLFANLLQCGIRRARANALIAMIPDLDLERTTKEALPRSSRDVRGGFVLLRPRKEVPCALWDCEAAALQEFLPTTQIGDQICMCHWAKLRLTTGQNCYSAWEEKEKPLEKHRTACNVKVCHPSQFVHARKLTLDADLCHNRYLLMMKYE